MNELKSGVVFRKRVHVKVKQHVIKWFDNLEQVIGNLLVKRFQNGECIEKPLTERLKKKWV